MLMHGTNTEWGAWADNLSMIMYIVLPWLFNIFTMSKWSINQFLKTYISIVVIYSIWRWFTDYELGINFNLFGVSIGLWAISEALYRFWSPLFRIISGFVGFIVLMLFFLMANSGLPGTSGFVGEFLVITASLGSNIIIGFLAATSLLLSASYSLKLGKNVLFGENTQNIQGYRAVSYTHLTLPTKA